MRVDELDECVGLGVRVECSRVRVRGAAMQPRHALALGGAGHGPRRRSTKTALRQSGGC